MMIIRWQTGLDKCATAVFLSVLDELRRKVQWEVETNTDRPK